MPYRYIFILCALMLFQITHLKAQKIEKATQAWKLLFEKTHTKFQLSGILGRGKINVNYGDARLENVLGVGVSVLWTQIKNFSPRWGLLYGFQGGGFPKRYKFHFTEKEFNFLQYSIFTDNNVLIPFISVPIQAIYRYPLQPKTYFTIEGGISFRFILEELFSLGFSNNNGRIYYLYSESEFNNNWQLNFNLNIGVSYLLPNHDFIDFRIISNYSPKNVIYNEYYLLYNTSGQTYGSYTGNASHVGISLGYTFTKVRKQMREHKKLQ